MNRENRVSPGETVSTCKFTRPGVRGYLIFFALLSNVGSLLAQPYTITTVAGTNRLLDGHPATTAPLRSPIGVLLDKSGNLYIADENDNRVRKVSPAGTISTFAGTGVPGYSGDRGPASQAELSGPTGLAIDSMGNIYIADYGNNVVRRVSPDGTINTVAGNGTFGFSGDKASATAAQVSPWAVAVDAQGNIYIADGYNYRVRKVDAKGIITTIAGNGQATYSGDSSSAVNASIDFPSSIAVDSAGNVYIASAFLYVLEIDPTGAISTVAGSLNPGYLSDGVDARQAFLMPEDIILDGNGGLYLSDWYSNRVRKVDLQSHFISGVAGNGSQGFSGDQGPPALAELSEPSGLAFDAAHDLYVADLGNGRVREITSSLITTVAGTAIGDGGAATSAFFNRPDGLAIDGSRNIVVADYGNYEARRFSIGGAIVSFGQLQPFSVPLGVAVDQVGNFYISDTEPRVLKVTPANVTTVVAGNGTLGYTGDTGQASMASISDPTGVAVDLAGNVYLTDYTNSRIRMVNPAGIINTIAGNGKVSFSGDNGPAKNAGMDPHDVAVDTQGNIYVADELNNRIRKITPNGNITTVAGTGVAGYSGDGGLATLAQFNMPSGIAVDTNGNLYIADYYNAVVRRVTAGGLITTIAGNGTLYPASGDGGPAISAHLDPFRIAVDAQGGIYITDYTNDRIRKLTPAPIVPATLSAVSGDGQSGGAGTVLKLPLVVKVSDRTGAGLAGVIVNFTVSPSSAATLSLASAITLNDGTASTNVLLAGTAAGTLTITAAVNGISSVSFSATVTSPNTPAISSGGVESAGLSTPAVTGLAANSIATIFGSQFAPAGTALQIGPSDLVNGKVPTVFGGVCVTFDGQRAPIFGVYSNQINLQVPQVGPGQVNVQVITQCDTQQAQNSATTAVQVQPAAPEFFYFTHTSNGHNAIAAVNAVTGAYVGAPGLISGANFTPANAGDYLTLYATGFGATNPSFSPGELPNTAAQVTAPVTITFGGVTLDPSDIQYVGATQDAGLYQVNIHVPANIPAGDQPLIITIGGVASPSTAYITVGASQ
jgi:uncharacterized protein (TIGR03437 family)